MGAAEKSVRIVGVNITHPARVLYPDAGVTKLGLAEYYLAIAERILPHLVGRPLSVVRCPAGLDPSAAEQGIHQTVRGPRLTKCFFQKHSTKSTSRSIRTVRAPEQKGMADYLAVDDTAGLVALIQFGTLEIHPWGARADRPDSPDRMFFDLDPGPSVPWRAVAEGAQTIRQILQSFDLHAFVKTTGGKGLHVVVPLRRKNTWDEVKSFSLGVARRMCDEQPEKYVVTMAKQARTGKIFVDYLRNARGSTAVAPFSARALPAATASMPVRWSELFEIRSDTFGVRNARDRLRRTRRDPWDGFESCQQVITKSMMKQLDSPSSGR